jgi:Xaa-Pro aminopeptidase
MKQDLDNFMKQSNIDCVLATGSAGQNPSVFYFTGNVHVHHADIIKQPGIEPVVFCNPMEREEAAKSGLEIRNLATYNITEILKESKGNLAVALAKRYKKILSDCQFETGRLGIYGNMDAGMSFAVFTELQNLMPEIEIVGELKNSVLQKAMATKDSNEADRIRKMGVITVAVVEKTKQFLQSHKAKDGVLVKENGTQLTVGDVKTKIDLWALALGAENPHGTIFSIGHDAGVPHNGGTLSAPMVLGKTIVFDIFLQEPGGRYHFDFTRTWILGHAPEAEQKLYDQVKDVFDEIMGNLEINASFHAMNEHVNERFEKMGHTSTRIDPLTENGYVHSLGHGLGLNLHEEPFSRDKKALLSSGVVVTIEPGLYYPEKDMGVRIEDSVYVHPDGKMEILAEYPYDFVIPIEEI